MKCDKKLYNGPGLNSEEDRLDLIAVGGRRQFEILTDNFPCGKRGGIGGQKLPVASDLDIISGIDRASSNDFAGSDRHIGIDIVGIDIMHGNAKDMIVGFGESEIGADRLTGKDRP